jgi:hypothetical protein
MARRGRSSIYVSTNPNVPVSIGTPGVSVFIGTPGPTIYAGSGSNVLPSSGVLQFLGGISVTFTPTTVPVVVEF